MNNIYQRGRADVLIHDKGFASSGLRDLRNTIKYALLQTFKVMLMDAETFGKMSASLIPILLINRLAVVINLKEQRRPSVGCAIIPKSTFIVPGIIWLSLLEEMKVYSNVDRLGLMIAEYSQQTDAKELLTAIGISTPRAFCKIF